MSVKLFDFLEEEDNGLVFFDLELENGLLIFLSFLELVLNGFLLLDFDLEVLPGKMLCTLLSDFALPKIDRDRVVLEDFEEELNILWKN